MTCFESILGLFLTGAGGRVWVPLGLRIRSKSIVFSQPLSPKGGRRILRLRRCHWPLQRPSCWLLAGLSGLVGLTGLVGLSECWTGEFWALTPLSLKAWWLHFAFSAQEHMSRSRGSPGKYFLRPRCESLSEGFPRRARDKYSRFVVFLGLCGDRLQLGNMFCSRFHLFS